MITRTNVRSLTLAVLVGVVVASVATAEAPFDAKRDYVFAQNAHGFKFDGDTLILRNVASTLYFGDGQFGQVANRDFVKHWSAEESPYAVLRTGSEEIVLGLANPKIKGSDITYVVTVVSGAANASTGACTLFIDPSRSAPAPAATADREPINRRDREAREVIAKFKLKDPSLEEFFKDAVGWAVFPSIAKGGFIIGGARGDGVVYHNDEVIGYSTLTQGTIGLQIGGQTYSEIIFFQDEPALNHFKTGNAEFSGQVSAVVVTAGASADAGYAAGVAVFTMVRGGAMLEASVGGQGFSFEEK
ncbi:MAG: lipid-binding SYLF domain-containing protein [Planctomycetes bacterium]|nr:lipid-binding SYLF domain-containing protein [Planctomycetota bacterium]